MQFRNATDAVRVIRNACPGSGQRALAREIVCRNLPDTAAVESRDVQEALGYLTGTPEATIYGAIRRIDAEVPASQTANA